MPNPKTNTVTFDVADAVKELKAGRVEFRVDKTGIIHVPVGRKSFTDEQLKGPYQRWHHTHTFTEENGGTRCDDLVDYRPPGGPLAPLINKLAVQRDVENIFAYRAKVLEEMFGGDQQTEHEA